MKITIRLFIIAIFLLHCFKLMSKPVDSDSVSSITAENWRQDLHYMVSEMQKVHENIFHTMTKEQLEKAAEALDKKIPSLSYNQIFIEFLKIMEMIGDGHTYLLPETMHSFPIKLYDFEDGVFVTHASDYRELIGMNLIGIGNKNINEIYKMYEEIIARDNDIWLKSLTPRQILIAEYLNGLGIINNVNNAEFIFEDKSGNRKSYILNSQIIDQQEYFNGSHIQKTDALSPLYLQQPDKFYWLEYLDDSKILYIKYNEVQFDRNENMNAFISRIDDIVNTKEVDKVVIDIRNNGGGNNFTSLPLVEYLSNNDKINIYGKLYTIIGRQTFSAASFFTTALENRTNTIFAGEPTGADPNHYGDNRPVILPNSKFSPRFSSIYWENSFASDNRKWTAPDIEVLLTSSDFFSHKDPVLEAIINHKTEPLNYTKLSPKQAAKFTGRFEFSPDQILVVKEKNGNLTMEISNFYKTIFYPDKKNHFQTSRKNVEVYFDESNNYNEITLNVNGNEIRYNKLSADKFLPVELFEMNRYEQAVSALKDLKKNYPERRSVSEVSINQLGYDLINKKNLMQHWKYLN